MICDMHFEPSGWNKVKMTVARLGSLFPTGGRIVKTIKSETSATLGLPQRTKVLLLRNEQKQNPVKHYGNHYQGYHHRSETCLSRRITSHRVG